MKGWSPAGARTGGEGNASLTSSLPTLGFARASRLRLLDPNLPGQRGAAVPLPRHILRKSTRWCLSLTAADSPKTRILIVPNAIMVSFEEEVRSAIVESALKHLRDRGLTAEEVPVSDGVEGEVWI